MTETEVEPRSKEQVAAEKVERFRRVAARRANNALKQIELLLRTANEGNYSFTAEQAEQIVSKLRSGVDRLEAAYAGSTHSAPKVEL